MVETYLYEMVLNEKDANRPQINARDGGATSDGCVRLIAENKKELTDRFLLLAQQAAIESGAGEDGQSTTQTTTTTKDKKTTKDTKTTKTTKTTRAPEPNATKRRVEFKINQISYFYVANPFGKEQNEIKEILRKNMPDKEFAKGEGSHFLWRTQSHESFGTQYQEQTRQPKKGHFGCHGHRPKATSPPLDPAPP